LEGAAWNFINIRKTANAHNLHSEAAYRFFGGVHPALALDKANVKFARRFGSVERLAAERGLRVGDASLEQLDAIWDEVKGTE